MSGLDPGDDALSRAHHQVRLLEIQLREAQGKVERLERKAAMAVDLAAAHHAEFERLLKLRDLAALEHERERGRRHALEKELVDLRRGWASSLEARTR